MPRGRPFSWTFKRRRKHKTNRKPIKETSVQRSETETCNKTCYPCPLETAGKGLHRASGSHSLPGSGLPGTYHVLSVLWTSETRERRWLVHTRQKWDTTETDTVIRGYGARAQEKGKTQQRRGNGGGCAYSGKQDPTLRRGRPLCSTWTVVYSARHRIRVCSLSKTVHRACFPTHTRECTYKTPGRTNPTRQCGEDKMGISDRREKLQCLQTSMYLGSTPGRRKTAQKAAKKG